MAAARHLIQLLVITRQLLFPDAVCMTIGMGTGNNDVGYLFPVPTHDGEGQDQKMFLCIGAEAVLPAAAPGCIAG